MPLTSECSGGESSTHTTGLMGRQEAPSLMTGAAKPAKVAEKVSSEKPNSVGPYMTTPQRANICVSTHPSLTQTSYYSQESNNDSNFSFFSQHSTSSQTTTIPEEPDQLPLLIPDPLSSHSPFPPIPPIPSSLQQNSSSSTNLTDNVNLKNKRRKYGEEARKDCLEILKQCNNNTAEALKIIRKTSGYEKLEAKSLTNWQKNGGNVHQSGGRLVNEGFEKDVKDKLMMNTLMKLRNGESIETQINVAYSYGNIQSAALSVRNTLKWKEIPKIQMLKISPKWVQGFLKRNNLSRRAITSSTSATVESDTVKRTIDIIKEIATERPLFNMDETGITVAPPTHLYCKKGEKRAHSSMKACKDRITAVLTVSKAGEFLPILFILKYSGKIKKNFFERVKSKCSFNDEWEIVENDESCYLRNKSKEHVITCNEKAWMTINIMKIYIKSVCLRMGERACLVMDNFSAHLNAEIKSEFINNGVTPLYLHPNTTASTQPLDVAVNFQLKAALRRKICRDSVDHLQNFKTARTEAIFEQRNPPSFQPLSPTIYEVMCDVINVVENDFATEKFKCGVSKTFQNIGLIESTTQSLNIPITQESMNLTTLSSNFDLFPIDESDEVEGLFGVNEEEDDNDNDQILL